MAQDRQYEPRQYVYKSLGLAARWELDQVPEFYYLDMQNMQEREENSISSRYGTLIVNRDPSGSGTSNHFFSSPITSLAKQNYQSLAFRYTGLADGTLWQRIGNGQGAYTQIYSGLSGFPFQSLTTNCFETSLPYLFIYDQSASIKIAAGSSTPQLTGIDPPTYTANTRPYSPLLTLIDNFLSTNSYTATGFDAGTPWAFSSVATITVNGSQTITDFPEFFNVGSPHTLAGSTVTAHQGSTGSSTTTTTFSGFPSVGVTPTSIVSLSIPFTDSTTATGPFGFGWQGYGTFAFFYSTDGGVTWTAIGTDSTVPNGQSGTKSSILGSGTWNVSPGGLTNLSNLQVQVQVTSTVTTSFLFDLAANSVIGTITATVTAAGVFGQVCNGILSNLGTATIHFAVIVSVVSQVVVGGFYTQLLITTSTVHGQTTNGYCSLYGTSNPLVDGFYRVVSTPTTTTFVVAYLTATALSAQGGIAYGGTSGANECILTNEYDAPYPTQVSAWGFYESVPPTTTTFPIGCWSGKVDTNTTATVSVTNPINLSINNQVNDSDLVVLVMQVSAPANIASIKLQIDIDGSGYTSSYYTTTISPAFYQGSITNQLSAYQATQNQILADTLGLISGQPVSSTVAQLQPSNFSTGSNAWVAVLIPRGNFLPVGNAGQSGLDWINGTGWQVVIQTTSTAVTGDGSCIVALNGLYLQWGYGPSSFAGVGYDWRYTYYNANTGTESSPSPIQEFNKQYGYLASLSAPFYLRQAAQVQGLYSPDAQVTHVRLYRRGGIYASNWFRTLEFVNVTGTSTFSVKDVTADAVLSQGSPLVLDNDPPVTSSLPTPIQTTLAAATSSPGTSIYSQFTPQIAFVTGTGINFVAGQIVLVGDTFNLEEVMVTVGGTNTFTAIFRLQHNAGETVSATSIPRQKCSLCALSNQGGITQVWLAGDSNNPHYLYRSKPGFPENFSPADYIPVSSPDDPIVAVINWRGTIVVGTLKSWWIVIGGARPYAQPTGAQHGIVASQGWAEVEGAIWFLATDGLREFVGADGVYMTLPVEWLFRNNATGPVPLVDLTQASSTILAYFQNQVYASYISQVGGGTRYRLIWDRNYRRYRYDDIPATAMLWEKDTNQLVVGKQISPGQFAVVLDQQYNLDYDDGGWSGGVLVKTPISLILQTPYRVLGLPHFPKQWNMLEGDYNTQGQTVQTTLLFKGEQDSSLVLAGQNTGTTRSKVQFQITAVGQPSSTGVQAYSMSIKHTMSVTVAPVFYQENIYATALADFRSSYDTYVQKFGTDLLKLIKDGYFDYSGTAQLVISIYADGQSTPYYVDSTTLIPQTTRAAVRVIFAPRKCRLWRMTVTSTAPFQLWSPIAVEVKPLQEGSGYQQYEFPVYQEVPSAQ